MNASGPNGKRGGPASDTTQDLIATVDDLLLAEVIEAGGIRAASEGSGLMSFDHMPTAFHDHVH